MKIGITGASGFLGQHLVRAINARAGWSAVGFTRDPSSPVPGCAETRGVSPEPDVRGLDAIVNLAGASIFKRWSEKGKQELLSSRVDTTSSLVAAIQKLEPAARPKVLVSASGIGLYGDSGDNVLDESSQDGGGFLADMAQTWEKAAFAAEPLGVRVVTLRISMVLGPDGGAFKLMKLPFSLGLGAKLGNGNQWMSWIHVDDLVSLTLHAIETDSLSGAVNATAPEPVRNADFTKALGRALHRPAFFWIPAFKLRLLLGEMSSMMLDSIRAVPAKAQANGFTFRFPTLDAALAELVKR